MADWFYRRHGQTHGPVSRETLLRLCAAGTFDRRDYVWREGMAEWTPAENIPELGLCDRTGAPPDAYHSRTAHYHPAVETSRTAIASFIWSLVGWFICPIIGHAIGIALGRRALREIRACRGRLTGEGFAMAGIVLGWLGLVPVIAVGIIILLGAVL